MHLNRLHCNDHHPHPSTHHISSFNTLHTKQHITMADRLPLAKLSIQNTIPPPTEMVQPIKMMKVHPLKLPNLCHLCSLDALPSPANKWSAMTHPLWATVMGFCGMVILMCAFLFPSWSSASHSRLCNEHNCHHCRRRRQHVRKH